MLSSLISSVGGAGERVGGGDCWDSGWSRCRSSNRFFSPILGCIYDSRTFRMHPSRASGALVAHSSTCDVASTYWTRILCSRAWVRMYMARHL